MKRLHLHIKTNKLDQSVAFYTAMFGQEPTQLEVDYAKWLLDDPRAHVSLSSHSKGSGVDHAGISIETEEELDAIAARLDGLANIAPDKEANCCYAKSNKYWARDPQGTVWELFQTYAHSDNYGQDPVISTKQADTQNDCCAPRQANQ